VCLELAGAHAALEDRRGRSGVRFSDLPLLSAEFESERHVQLLIPRRMSERYQHGLETVSTEIVYSNLRRFDSAGHAIR
jgi:hypothetical protein